MKQERIVPLAISDIDGNHICVAGINEEGSWIRPEPLFISDIDNTNSHYFDYKFRTEVTTLPSTADEKRIEDRDIVRDYVIKCAEEMTMDERRKIIIQYMDKCTENIFNQGRTAGIVRVAVTDIRYGRTFGNGKKVRITYKDDSGEEFNFILVERDYKAYVLSLLDENEQLTDNIREKLIEDLQEKEIYFTITLTRKSTGFPGKYNGCHPLISGVHVF